MSIAELLSEWDDDGATRGGAFLELRDAAFELEAELAATTHKLAEAEFLLIKMREAIQAELDPAWECNSYHPKLVAAGHANIGDRSSITDLLAEERERLAVEFESSAGSWYGAGIADAIRSLK
jgi:hypothetical protein